MAGKDGGGKQSLQVSSVWDLSSAMVYVAVGLRQAWEAPWFARGVICPLPYDCSTPNLLWQPNTIQSTSSAALAHSSSAAMRSHV